MKTDAINIAMVAGEPSGDLLAASLMASLLRQYPNANFIGIGGPRMQALGFQSFFPMEMLSVNGLVEVLKHLPSIAKMRGELIEKIIAAKPDIFIGVDAPDFNLGLEYQLRKRGLRTMHYISPTIWAWRTGRIHKIARAVDHILVLFPFEAPLYQKQQIGVTYVGHPLADDIPMQPDTLRCRQFLGCEDKSPIFALLPGSRNSELHFHADLLIQTAQQLSRRYPDSAFIVPCATEHIHELFNAAIGRQSASDLPFMLLNKQSSEAIQAADVVILSSGTATLETALWKKPMVITYKTSWLSWKIAKKMVRLTHVGLPNILLNKEVVPEYLQDDATADNLTNAASDWIDHPEKTQQLIAEFEGLHQLLRKNASDIAAQAVIAQLSKETTCIQD